MGFDWQKERYKFGDESHLTLLSEGTLGRLKNSGRYRWQASSIISKRLAMAVCNTTIENIPITGIELHGKDRIEDGPLDWEESLDPDLRKDPDLDY
tara:strand:- start:327 stop:614 length:288 start_codon:yes stop_codon:yes gene_type:complete